MYFPAQQNELAPPQPLPALQLATGLAEKLEQGNINLDESVELYAQASKLVVACQKKLGAAQLKLEKLEPKPMEENQEQKEEQDV